jgi:hypothetical protein
VSDIALYYPYVNLPSDAWVKAAALHWTRLARIRPEGSYGLRDSETVQRLRDELGFVLDVHPGIRSGPWVGEDVLRRVDRHHRPRDTASLSTEDQVDALFYDFLDTYQEELVPRYGTAALGLESLDTWEIQDHLLPLDPRLEEVHPGKLSYGLAQRLAEAGLLLRRRYRWRRESDGRVLDTSDLAMHRRLAAVYLAVLAEVVARENGLSAVTDQAPLCAAAADWTVEAVARALLTDDDADAEAGAAQPAGPAGHAEVFAVLALRTVLPQGLADVPVGRIIEARRRLLPELMRYRAFLDSLATDFVEISAAPDPEVRAARLRDHVESRIAQPVAAMERELGRLGMQPARAVLCLQTLAPPAALGIVANAAHLPSAVTGAGVAAGCLIGATSSALDQRRRTLAGHPAGYLLSLRHELGPSAALGGACSWPGSS